MLGVARVVCILMMTTLSACGVSGISEHHETTVDASAAPVGLATFVRPALGWPGRMYGYIEGWPAGHEDLSRGSRGPLFTYAMDFRVVKTNQAFGPGLFGFPVKCVGLRRTYFYPGGARVAFSDPSRFVNGEPVAIDRVEFTVDTTPVWGQVMF